VFACDELGQGNAHTNAGSGLAQQPVTMSLCITTDNLINLTTCDMSKHSAHTHPVSPLVVQPPLACAGSPYQPPTVSQHKPDCPQQDASTGPLSAWLTTPTTVPTCHRVTEWLTDKTARVERKSTGT
jgi:hypothetical protein